MINLSYNISSNLEESINRIDSLRAIILLSVVSPKIELEIRWETLLDRVFCSLNLAGNSLTKLQMTKILMNIPKKVSEEEKEVIRYRNSLDYITQNWLAEPQPVTAKTLITLHDLYRPGKLRPSNTMLKDFFNYLQINPTEHPIVQAAVSLAHVTALAPFSNANGITARLLAYLFLYKYGYDFRKMLVFEKDWQKKPIVFQENLQNAIKDGNLTPFLEYFASGIANQLKELSVILKSDNRSVSKLWNLDERQKAILNYLEQPGMIITNRKAQSLLIISQITASRNLAKLTRLGLIFPNGRGRSVYYTKI